MNTKKILLLIISLFLSTSAFATNDLVLIKENTIEN